MKKILAMLLVIFSSLTTVNAASLCSYQEQSAINQKAANIKPSYEVITNESKTLEPGSTDSYVYATSYSIKITILNMTEEFYIVLKNDITKEDKIFRYEDTNNGTITYDWNNINEVTNFTIEVYTSNKTSCPNERYKVLYLTTPRYNPYSERDFCYENKDFALCKTFVMTKGEISEQNFQKQISSFQNTKENNNENPKKDENPTFFDKLLTFLNKNKWTILGSSVIIGAGIFIIVINIKKKKQRELGL